MNEAENLQNADNSVVTYEPMLAPVFNYQNVAENLCRFVEMKAEIQKQKVKKLTPNEKSLLYVNDSLTDYLIELCKAILVQKNTKISGEKDICPYCKKESKYKELKCCEQCSAD